MKEPGNHKEVAGFVAAEVKKYFKRIGNRDVFRNGMSASEVGLAMMTDSLTAMSSQRKDDGKATINRIKNAKRRITPEQTRTFCEVVGLTTDEQLLFESARLMDDLAWEGMDVAMVALAPTINLIIRNLNLANDALLEGKLELAMSMISSVFRWKDEMGDGSFGSPFLIRIYTLMTVEREKLIQMISQQWQSFDLSYIELVDAAPLLEVVGELSTKTRLQLTQSIHNPNLLLTQIEQKVWEGLYRHKQSISEVAASLFLQPGTVQSIRESIEQRILAELVHQLRTVYQLP